MAKKSTRSEGAKRPNLRGLASQVAKLDESILAAAAERAQLMAELQQLRPEEEAASLIRTPKYQGLDSKAAEAILREVMASTRPAAGRQRVAYLGPEDSFSHLTAIARFGEASDLVPVSTIGAVFEEVASGGCTMGVVPLENSTHGRVTDTLEAFSKHEVRVCGEAPMRIHHCLLGKGKRGEVKQVYSKPQALAQCAHWLSEHLPGAELHAAASTSGAAQLAAEDSQVAAIASEQAGLRHGLTVLARNIEDQKDNVTRFAIIGPEPAEKTGDDKTALMLEIAHEPGSLADAMAIFKRHQLNMTWIESFPIPGSRSESGGEGRYLFFIEFMAHATELRARRAISSLEKKCTQLRVLGSYARSRVLG